MANLKSSKKDVRRSNKRRDFNTGIKSAIKTYIKKAKKALGSETAAPTLSKAISAIDKAAQGGTIHKNQAARRKSRLMKAANAGAPAVEVATKPAAKSAAKPAAKKAAAKGAK